MTDPISDMLTQIRNALSAKKGELSLRHSILKENLARVLEHEGWIKKVEVTGEGIEKSLRLELSYTPTGIPSITGIKRVSKPGQRIYARVTEIPRMRLGVGATIISTSRGIMTDKQARREKIGGEVICQIW
ncbi:MAG: 30S ribosomal protein S8 [Candidatus Doudnabacteria bacterium RIFCSPHIGHO2_01_52_17]|uniref:Small ribosomal subunit protein uS8 n=1 Tax=Candidatus Doudnabacteria bacterium RIFCSPHIGHO2_01_52_17 TaxID=1817820 RepID=A0A1F5N8D7_9BACT|nr:ribosomal protein S8 [uncultured bacterium]OGE73926.1 MAG: 30S ribosomal protein S8 [Candidatus Doudnabacteria bacterium RIFCSPHIGHO2_01_52_17]